MKKINILKENKDFDDIIKNQDVFKTRYYLIYVKRESNPNAVYKFGVSVSKKIGNAVTRNLYKRRIRNIIDKKKYKNDFKCVIILRKMALDASFTELEESLINSLIKLKLIKES